MLPGAGSTAWTASAMGFRFRPVVAAEKSSSRWYARVAVTTRPTSRTVPTTARIDRSKRLETLERDRLALGPGVCMRTRILPSHAWSPHEPAAADHLRGRQVLLGRDAV